MVIVETDAFKSVEVMDNKGEILRIDEGMNIEFATETGESIQGKLTKISGKGAKTKLQIIPKDSQKEEIWSVLVMADGSLTIDNE